MRLGVLATNPIQFQVPLWRKLSALPGIDLTVFYFSDDNLSTTYSPEFGQHIKWDVPLLEGYVSEFVGLSGRSVFPAPMFLSAPAHFQGTRIRLGAATWQCSPLRTEISAQQSQGSFQSGPAS